VGGNVKAAGRGSGVRNSGRAGRREVLSSARQGFASCPRISAFSESHVVVVPVEEVVNLQQRLEVKPLA